MFIKKVEDFICEHCGHEVKGNGYTNHCPKCLWSKHVDQAPGDREEECGGLMEPIDAVLEKQDWILVHQCQTCDVVKRNMVCPEDDFDQVIAVKEKANKKFTSGNQ